MTENKINITAVINCRNESHHLEKCIKSISNLVQEIIVVDMESTDNSPQLAKKMGARVIPHPWLPVVEPARNFGISQAKGTWILLLDPDERLTRMLRIELKRISHLSNISAVKIPRKNLVFKKWLKHGNCWPDYLIRFFRKGQVQWLSQIHSQPKVSGEIYTLPDNPNFAIKHFNYKNIDEYVYKALRYSQKQAEELFKVGYRVKAQDFLLKPAQEFNQRYFSGQGFKDGIHGLAFALLQASTELLKYTKLWELEGSQDKNISKESLVSALQQTAYETGHWFTKYFIEEYTKNPLKVLLIKTRQIINRLTKNF